MTFKEDDMEKMIGYIFGSLHNNEQAIEKIGKALKKQNRFNAKVAIFSIGVAAYVYLNELRIKALVEEIEELEEAKGE